MTFSKLRHPITDASSEDVMSNVAVDIRQSKISPGVTKRQSLVVQPQCVKNGGVQIMHVDGVVGGCITKVIR